MTSQTPKPGTPEMESLKLMAPYQGPGFPTAIYPFGGDMEDAALADNVESDLAREMSRRWNTLPSLEAERDRLRERVRELEEGLARIINQAPNVLAMGPGVNELKEAISSARAALNERSLR